MRWTFGVGAVFVASTIAKPTSSRTVNKRYVEERNGINYNVFEHAATSSKMSFIKNSGICETTPGVNQYSGYISVGEGLNMWFWFFEARQNPQEAPLAAYFEGGPGDGSEYGLFTQHGPCHFVNNETTPSLNPYSFNEYANMLYVDQPIGAGFSYGNVSVNSTKAAAPYVWTLLQAFYNNFPEYENRDFGLWTESYGGHYGPEFVKYILDQNAAIASGDLEGEEIRVTALGINNGWFDARIQEKANVDYAFDNSYRQFINESYHTELLSRYDTNCTPALERCAATDTSEDCFNAWNSYMNEIEYPLLAAMREGFPTAYPGDIRWQPLRPSSTYVSYLQRADIQKAPGAEVNYTDSIGAGAFIYGGDDPRSFLSQLSAIVQSGIPIVSYAGDADYVCNWLGVLQVADEIQWPGQKTFANQTLEPYTLNGVQKGTFKSLDNLIFMRIFEAGHNVPFYQPEASLQIFERVMKTGGVAPT